MKGLIIALQFMTRLPMPRVTASAQDFARSMRCFPVVGLILGALIAAACGAGARIDPWVGALLGLIAWVGLTGALHLDGLGDMADAAGAAHKDRDRLRAVLSDPHVGSFGVVAIALQLIAKLVLLHTLVDRTLLPALVLIPFAARIAPLWWTRLLPPLHEGLGTAFRGAVRPVDLALWAAVWLLACWWVPGLLAAPMLMLGWGVWLRQRIGGISGDGHGAGIELVESGLLLAVLL
ncbi:MAG: adenosylcobinamide-GDP ribazoletransferase [Alphaproteobacteria bacterium]|jgi:adenosylcobinamide-GDP ribazoletransferase